MGRRPSNNTRAANATAAWAALAVAVSGCSFIFSEGAPADLRARESFQCGESVAPPVADTVAAGLLALGAVGAARDEDAAAAKAANPDQSRRDSNVTIGVSAALAVLDVASAVYGYQAAAGCRAAQRTRLAAVARATALPPPYGAPPDGQPPRLWPPPRAAPATPSP